MPFGHHASLIKVTERKFEPRNPAKPTEDRVAVLRQRFFIIVREHVKTYAGAGTTPGWFDYPLAQVEILTKVTPSLMAPDDAACKVIEVAGKPIYTLVPPRAAFWPMLTSDTNAGNFRFEVAATDICGQRFTFAMPLLFIGDEANTGMAGAQAIAANVVAGYNKTAEDPRRTAPTGGVTICFAPSDPDRECHPSLPTTSLAFVARPVTASLRDPHFAPTLLAGACGIPQFQRLLGLQQRVRVEYPDLYRASGFGGGNSGEVFLKLPTPHELKFGGTASDAKSDALGALASPAMAIQGMSRLIGPVAAAPPTGGQTVEHTLQNVIGNSFDPTDFFKDAKILGGIDLGSILKAVALASGDVPRMLTRELPDRIEAAFHFATEITKSDPLNLLVPGAGGATMLAMDGTVSAPIGDPNGATFSATASLTHFKVNLFGFIIIWFDALNFKASRGTKPDVSVAMHEGDDSVMFGGPLEFVNDLRKFIPSNGFSDPPSLSVTPSASPRATRSVCRRSRSASSRCRTSRSAPASRCRSIPSRSKSRSTSASARARSTSRSRSSAAAASSPSASAPRACARSKRRSSSAPAWRSIWAWRRAASRSRPASTSTGSTAAAARRSNWPATSGCTASSRCSGSSRRRSPSTCSCPT